MAPSAVGGGGGCDIVELARRAGAGRDEILLRRAAHALAAQRLACVVPAVRMSAATAVDASALLAAIDAAGTPVGIKATEEAQEAVSAAAEALRGTGAAAAARVPISGTYELLWSMAKGGSNGKVGPFVGSVTQEIVDDENFINAVKLGPLKIALSATREVLDDKRIRVKFVSTSVRLFGKQLLDKPTKGQGVWEQIAVNDDASLRVMNTPSLFVLRRL